MRTFIAATIVVLAGSAAWAAGLPQDGRFDDYVLSREGGVIALSPRSIEDLSPLNPVRRAWSDFAERHGGDWSIYLDNRSGMPTLVSGSGIELFPADDFEDVTLDEAEVAVLSFLAAHVGLLGDWTAYLELDDEASVRLREDHWQLVFRQQVNGVRVENARLDFHVNRGRLTMFGASNWGVPKVGGLPRIDAADARDLLDAYLDVASSGHEETAKPELVLMALDAEPALDRPRAWTGERGAGLSYALVWRIQFRDPESPALWVAEIDAHDGKVRGFYDGAHYSAIRGGVLPEAPDVGCVSGSCEIDDFPMPYADWTESGQSQAYADAFGGLTCAAPEATFETRLNGPYAIAEDNCGPILETAGCTEDVSLGLKAGENCAVAPGSSPGNTAAARSSYYHVNRVAEVARFYNPGSSWLQSPIRIITNWPQTCNAVYGANTIYLYQSNAGMCTNTGENQGIAVHEWGHGYDHNDGGGQDNTSEAYGDIVSMFATRSSCFGTGLRVDGTRCTGYGDTCLTCTGFRDFEWTARLESTPATPQGFVTDHCGEGSGPCGGEVHCESYPISEAVWDFISRDLPAAGMDADSAWQLAERLWYTTRAGSGGPIYTCALPDSDSCAASSWYQRMRVADDDDANPANGSPHAAELYSAFARHNIACGLPGDPENQSTSSCPALAKPVITVTETSSGTEIAWVPIAGAAEYVVYRGELGCDNQQVPAATVAAGTTAWLDSLADTGLPRQYRVEVIGANPVCRSAVSDCGTTPAIPRLQMNSYRLVEPAANTNGNGVLDPGETVELPVTLFNGGFADAVAVTGRLRTVDATQGRVIEPVAGWPDIWVATEFESNAPHFALTLFTDGVACGDTVELELEMDADAAPIRTSQFEFTLGEKDREYFKQTGAVISRFNTSPILSTFDIADDTVIGELDISVDISHSIPGDLIVELSSPMGTTVRLHDRTPGTGGIVTRYDLEISPDGPGAMADFDGESLAGTWTLSVQNTVLGGGSGNFNNWTLHVTSAGAFGCSELICAEPTPAQAVDGLSVDKSAQDLLFGWDSAGAVFGYHVLQSPSPDFSDVVHLTGSASATSLTIPVGAPGANGATYYQVRAVNSCHQESP